MDKILQYYESKRIDEAINYVIDQYDSDRNLYSYNQEALFLLEHEETKDKFLIQFYDKIWAQQNKAIWLVKFAHLCVSAGYREFAAEVYLFCYRVLKDSNLISSAFRQYLYLENYKEAQRVADFALETYGNEFLFVKTAVMSKENIDNPKLLDVIEEVYEKCTNEFALYDVLYLGGLVCLRNHDYGKAIFYLERSLECKRPITPQAYLLMGLCYDLLNDNHKSEEMLEKCIESAGTNKYWMMHGSIAYYLNGEHEKAFETAANVENGDNRYLTYAILYSYEKKYAEALDNLRKVIKGNFYRLKDLESHPFLQELAKREGFQILIKEYREELNSNTIPEYISEDFLSRTSFIILK